MKGEQNKRLIKGKVQSLNWRHRQQQMHRRRPDGGYINGALVVRPVMQSTMENCLLFYSNAAILIQLNSNHF